MSRMPPFAKAARTARTASTACALLACLQAHAADRAGWSVVPYVGASAVGDQSPRIAGAGGIADGELDIAVDAGFVAGLGVRYGYAGSRWSSEIAWEYRSNDARAVAVDGAALPGGNYASNTFFLNGRYALREGGAWTPWLGIGLSWVQELDLDSEDAQGERSFSDAGSIGYQIMAGADLALSERFYLGGELRYSGRGDLDLDEEGGDGRVSDIDYAPVTLGLGLGVRF